MFKGALDIQGCYNAATTSLSRPRPRKILADNNFVNS